LLVQFGSALGNMRGAPGQGGMPWREVLNALRNYRRHLKIGDMAVISIEQNDDEASLHRCYGDSIHQALGEELLARAERQLPHDGGFKADNFHYVRGWDAASHLYWHGFEAIRDNQFQVNNLCAEWKQGQVFSYA